MSDKHPIRNGIIATVVGGIILAALGVLWPPAQRLLTTNVSVPIWLCVLVVAIVCLGLAAYNNRRPKLQNDRQASGQPSAPLPIERAGTLDVPQRERDVLRRVAKDDGQPVLVDTLRRSLGTTNLQMQTALDRLTSLDLVEVIQDTDDEEHYVWLTARGRRYVTDERLV